MEMGHESKPLTYDTIPLGMNIHTSYVDVNPRVPNVSSTAICVVFRSFGHSWKSKSSKSLMFILGTYDLLGP